MKYYFTGEQYLIIWDRYKIQRSIGYLDDRIDYWQKHVQPKVKLTYDESNEVDADDNVDNGWYGAISGLEKDINWFLLQL
jgi:hypothetical protein